MSFTVLLFLLRIGFLFILYLFLFTVVRVLWRTLNTTAAMREAVVPASSRVRLRIISPGHNGLANQVFDLWSNASLGRAPDNTIVLPDTSVSAHHARVGQENGQWWVQDL
ncbi:MAG: FHA domain-containing protein, partial [Chloroflexota bacterium]